MNIQNLLKKFNKSITKERIEIFNFIEKNHIFSSNDLINNFKDLGRASIFRTINLFLEIEILRKISLGDRNDFYELNNLLEHHEHMKCEKCGIIINFDSKEICKNLDIKAKNIGFKIKNHSINIIGICEKCLKFN